MQLEFYTVDQILVKVKYQIDILKYEFHIQEERIRVSIPHWFQNITKDYYKINDLEKSNLIKLFGSEIVLGYNNEIAVFDMMADPRDNFLEPIKICETKLVNMYDYVSAN